MKRRSLYGATVAAGALLVGGTVAALAPVSAAPPQTKAGQVTIYSDTFEPFSLMPDGDSVNRVRYADADSVGPGASPVTFVRIGGTGHDAFFNSPDLTIAGQPMSAVSAEVCLKVRKGPDVTEPNVFVDVLVGVQDFDQNFVLAKGLPELTDPEMPIAVKVTPETTAPCVTMTFDKPVKLVNHPHLVTVLDLRLRGSGAR